MKLLNFRRAILAAALVASVPTFANAQDTREPARADRDDRPDFGWLGLLGLVGLFGLKRRDREHDAIHDRDRAAMRTR
jgi:MYXO-CTERM domain-containing protein